MSRRSWIGVFLMLAAVLFSGLARTWNNSAEQDKHQVALLVKQMQTVCVGRFLIEIPEETNVEIGAARVDGFDVATFEENFEDFQKRLADREEQIRTTPDRPDGKKNLESVEDVKTAGGLVGKMFVHNRTVREGTRANGLELEHYRDEGVTVEALVHGTGISIDLSSQGRDPARIGDLSVPVPKLVANPENRIPPEPGLCIDRAYIRDPLTADQGKQITMFAGLPSHPDVRFMLIIAAGTKPDEQGLLARSGAAGSWLSLNERLRITRLRAAPREIAGLPGEELVSSFLEHDDVRVYSFWWEVNGTDDNVYIPHFVFKMNTGNSDGKPVPSSLSEAAALALWDRILSSIRVWPTNQPKGRSLVPASLLASMQPPPKPISIVSPHFLPGRIV